MLKRTVLVALVATVTALPAFAQKSAVDPKEIDGMTTKAYDFLKSKQKEDGSFEPARGNPGSTALVIAALVHSGYKVDDPVVAKGLKYLEGNIKKDGGVYNGFLANYSTCVAVMAFKEANTKGQFDKVIENAAQFLKTIQNTDDPKALKFGGVGYGKGMNGDVSNQHFFIEALIAAGVSKDDPAVKNALIFLSHCQNLPGDEANPFPYAKKTTEGDKGGFVYNPFATDDKKSSDKVTPEGGLRSEGGMTYAGLKSFLYAGVGKDDPRVKAALGWVRKHYTLEENPGMGQAGLFYYFLTFSKAMEALGDDEFADDKGTKHDWRKELAAVLKGKQAEDGSWANKNATFLENSPELGTAYAVLALSYCKPKK